MKRVALIAWRLLLWPIVFAAAVVLVAVTFLGWGTGAAERVFESL